MYWQYRTSTEYRLDLRQDILTKVSGKQGFTIKTELLVQGSNNIKTLTSTKYNGTLAVILDMYVLKLTVYSTLKAKHLYMKAQI